MKPGLFERALQLLCVLFLSGIIAIVWQIALHPSILAA